MLNSSQLSPGTTISVDNKIYRVESAVKVTVAKGNPFIKTKLKDLISDQLVEKNFKIGQTIQDVSLLERKLEYLYLEGKDHLFLDVGTLNQVTVPASIIGEKVHFLKEGIEVKAMFYGDNVFSIELPQFLELMIVKTDPPPQGAPTMSNTTKEAVLETGAKIVVPLFIDTGDIIKVDTITSEYIQRV
ncbi:MAG: elongation factor P [Verrucomicrobia bacterium]|nr:elongation factor P [Verrucomicrobiota bacterium]